MGIEETVPVFLCGLESENLWAVHDELSEDKCCPTCLERVKNEELPLGLD